MSKHKLLLADDSITIQKVVNLTFADEGIEVISVGDGNSAIEKFAESRPDLVMVDVNMPGVDGYRICEFIKQNEETKDVPVILLVGSFEPFDEEEARRVGANDYLTKPFQSIRQLVNKVTVLLTKSNGQEVSSEAATPSAPTVNFPPIPRMEEPETFEQTSEEKEIISSPLGDAGMDDEMIQTNQIGSLPVDDLQKYGPTGTSFERESFSDRFDGSSFRAEEEAEKESEPDGFGKTQPLTAEEFKEYTFETPEKTAGIAEEPKDGEIAGQIEQDFSGEQTLSGQRDAYLEERMVSEFESETLPAPEQQDVSDEPETPHLTSPEDYFSPREIAEDKPLDVVEVPQEKGFIIEEIQPEQDISIEDKIRAYPEKQEPEISPQDFYNLPETFEAEHPPVQEILVEPEASELLKEAADFGEPEAVAEQPAVEEYSLPDEPTQAFVEEHETPKIENELQTDAAEQYFSKEEIGETFEPDETVPLSELVSEPSFGKEPWQTGLGQPEYDEIDTMESAVQTFERQPAVSEPLISEDSEEISENVQEMVGMPEPITVVEETVQIQEPVEIRKAPIMDAFPAEETEPAAPEEADQPLEIAPETTHSKVNALVSNKDKTGAVESVIISEFARQSISLSSEAVETIAARIAEKISEKIIQEMASEVVSDLADLIVERMERKRQQE